MTGPATKRIGYAERAAFYELEYDDPSDQELLAGLLTPAVRSVLEIPCGAGKNTLHLLRPGRRFVAVDREPAMVRRVLERTAGRPGSNQLEAVVGDLRDLDLGEAFDLVLVQREAFQMIGRQDAGRALAALRRHLAPGGTLLFDLATFERGDPGDAALGPRYFDPGLPDGVAVEEWTRTLPTGESVTRRRVQRHRPGRVVEVEYHYDVRPPQGPPEKWTANLVLTQYSRDEVLALAAAAGLVPRRVDRDYRGRPHGPGAVRMVFFFAGEE